MNDKTLQAHQQRYTDAIRQARQAGENQFHGWFDQSKDVNQSIIRGFWDFSVHILTPTVCAALRTPETKTALEIGYGGGRLLNAAASHFGGVVGIDIHNNREAVTDFLTSQGNNNFQLLRTNGAEINVPAQSVDFIYSFIVLQHLPNFSAFAGYIAETARCLKTGGLAQLYFGHLTLPKQVRRWRQARRGYLEIPDAPVNNVSLLVRLGKVKSLCRRAGLRVVATGRSYKDVPDGFKSRKGGQKFVTVIKD